MTAAERAALLAALPKIPREGAPLTGRQQEFLTLLAEGLTVEQIAARLYLSPTTVMRLRRVVYRKLGAPNGPAAVNRGWQLGYLGRPRGYDA